MHKVLTAYCLLFISTLLLPSPAVGGEPGILTVPGFNRVEAARAVGISIEGPSQVARGSLVSLRLNGTPTVNLEEPLLAQLDWLMGEDRMLCFLVSPKRPPEPLSVECRLVFGMDGATIRPEIEFVARDQGDHTVIVDWNSGQNQLVIHQITVGDGPEPPQPPDPPDPPEPDVEFLYGLVLYQSELIDDDPRSAEISQVLLGLRLMNLDENFQWMKFDLDKVDADGDVPEEFQPWYELIKDKQLDGPQLFLIDQDGKLLENLNLPATVDGVITLVREYLP